MIQNFEMVPILSLMLIILCSTFVPFFISWAIKLHCNNRHLAFRFISRKWIITVLPCAMTVYLITLHNPVRDDKILMTIIIWSAVTSGLFLLGEHISQLFSKLYSIRYKDVNIVFDETTGHTNIIEKESNNVE